MPNYILTGAPGSGKTAIVRQLELLGHAVVEEAATDVIALHHALGRPEPWRHRTFIEDIVVLQRKRQLLTEPRRHGSLYFDRSPVCTLALSRHLSRSVPRCLTEEINRIVAGGVYERTVFFVRNQGFVEPTAARRISFEDALVFEQAHERAYRSLGFELVDIPAAPLPDRVRLIEDAAEALHSRGGRRPPSAGR